MGSGDQTAKTASLLECQQVMEEIDALKGLLPRRGWESKMTQVLQL